MELKGNPNRKARGIVLEAQLDKGRVPVARILVQKGTFRVGDYVAMDRSFGKAPAMIDCNWERLKEASVELLGLNDTSISEDIFISFDTEKEAKEFSNTFIVEGKQKLVEDSKQKVILDAIFDKIKVREPLFF